MNKFVWILVLSFFCLSFVFSQVGKTFEIPPVSWENSAPRPIPGKSKKKYTLVTTNTGEEPPGGFLKPQPGSKRYKIKYEAQDSLSFDLYIREYIDGIIRPDDFDLIERWCNFKKGGRTTFEMIPDFTSDSTLVLFLNFPTGYKRYCYMNTHSGKSVKAAHFTPLNEEQERLTFVPVFLMYEDEPDDRMEKLVNSYLKEGTLPVEKTVYNEVFSQLQRYKLIYYEVKFHK